MNASLLFLIIAAFLFNSASAQPRCGKNEIYRECSSACEAKCGQVEGLMCVGVCGDPKCECMEGFFRHANGRCVSQAQC